MNVCELARPEIVTLKTYATESSDSPALARLDNNESPWPAPGCDGDLHRYPEQPPRELVRRMAAYYAVDGERVLPVRGSDDAIDALIRCFCRPEKDAVVVVPPTFGMYAIFAQMHGARVLELPLEQDFALPISRLTYVHDTVKLVFLCSPNNPTGRAISNTDIQQICNAWSGKALVVVDEAYAEFMVQASATTLLTQFENLVVLRTLSKGLALAGARVGVLLASTQIIALVRKVLPPYLLPTPSVLAANNVLADGAIEIARARIARIVMERDRLAQQLRLNRNVVRVFSSDANFLLVELNDVDRALEALAHARIRVRSFPETSIANCVRIGIGSAPENRRLLQALEG